MHNILSLISLEWAKFHKNTVFRAIGIITIVGLSFIILIGKKILDGAPPPLPSSHVLYSFPTVWDYQGYIGSWFVGLVLAFLVIYMITSEVGYKTMRQNIITGLTRKEYFLGKLGFVTVLALGVTALYYISCIIYGMIHTDVYDAELMFDNNWAGLRFFIMSMSYLSFAMLAAIIFKRGFLTLIMYIAYMMALEGIIRLIIIFKFQTRWPNFSPMNATEDLNPFPLLRLPDAFANKEWDFEFLLTYTEAGIAASIYAVLFVISSWYFFKKTDL